MKKDNQLVAYIQRKDQAPFIDIVKISKKGSSFYYAGVWWSRDCKMSMNQYCINAKGEKLKIKPLNRSYNLYEDYDGIIDIKETAKERYNSWLKGELNAQESLQNNLRYIVSKKP